MKTDKMIGIDRELHQEMKLYCVKNHLIMKRVLEDLIRAELNKQKKGTEVPNEMK
jgi:hypothetical protein